MSRSATAIPSIGTALCSFLSINQLDDAFHSSIEVEPLIARQRGPQVHHFAEQRR
jgi:hypothetical protein